MGTSEAIDGWVLQSTELCQACTEQPRPPIFTAVWLPGNSFDPALQEPSGKWPRDTGVELQLPSLGPGQLTTQCCLSCLSSQAWRGQPLTARVSKGPN